MKKGKKLMRKARSIARTAVRTLGTTSCFVGTLFIGFVVSAVDSEGHDIWMFLIRVLALGVLLVILGAIALLTTQTRERRTRRYV